MTPKEKLGVWIGGIAALVLALVFFSKCQFDLRREEARWASCLGMTVSGCKVPEGYEAIGPCAQWFDCRTEPASRSYVSSKEKGPSRGSYTYACWVWMNRDASSGSNSNDSIPLSEALAQRIGSRGIRHYQSAGWIITAIEVPVRWERAERFMYGCLEPFLGTPIELKVEGPTEVQPGEKFVTRIRVKDIDVPSSMNPTGFDSTTGVSFQITSMSEFEYTKPSTLDNEKFLTSIMVGIAQTQPGVYVDRFTAFNAFGGLFADHPVEFLRVVIVKEGS